MSDIRRVVGVILTAEDARTLAEAMNLFVNLLRRNGSRPTPKLELLRSQLESAADVRESDANVRLSGEIGPEGASSGRDLDTATAAAILGSTPAAVRDLARRGSIRGRRVGGRWFLSAAAVHERAARQPRC
ncbi:helix-turn-helix domain-containing protein [Rhodococcoides fascians A25f]|uniref:helix-turn-helix domain-containing protein n=1 Tax=Rhodococcoides fascians TaxID=1828 RepID=UPI0006900321|nr:helix-turn-helix domain-containing protein [Rhodococcus fascians]QII05905.1 helix-turn-helix domain-containing protein [Rhodococcus fascians A25f]